MKQFFQDVKNSFLLSAAVSIILGIVLIVYPVKTSLLICYIAGALLLFGGVVALIRYIASRGEPFFFLYDLFVALVLILFGRTLSMMFLSRDNVEVLDASAKYLRCMGYFYWSLGILNVSRMVAQGLGFSGRAFFSGVTEMIARTVVSLGFVGAFGYTAIWWSQGMAWTLTLITCYTHFFRGKWKQKSLVR